MKSLFEDDQFNIQKATVAASKVLEPDGARASVIGWVDTGKAVGAMFEQAERPLVVLWDSNEELDALGQHVFSIGFQTEAAGKEMAEFLFNKGIREVAVINHINEWSVLISKSFAEHFESLGGKIVTKQEVSVEETDFRTIILKAKDAEAIYAPLVGHLDVLLKQIEESGYEGTIACGDSLTEEIVAISEGAAEDIYLTTLFAPESESFQYLTEAYISKYGEESDLMIFTALGYDGVMVLAEAIELAQSTDPKEISKALYQVQNFEGAAGSVSINEHGSSNKLERIFQVQNGEMVLIE